MAAPYDVSVILPFRDDEDVIGNAVQRLAAHLRELGLSFELLAVDEDSGDNSHAVLALLRGQVPELRVQHAPFRGRGAEAGIARAQGRVLWVLSAHAAVSPLATFQRAYEQVVHDEIDAVIVRPRFAVAHRVRVLGACSGLRGNGPSLLRRMSRRFAALGLRVDVQELSGGPATARAPSPRFRLRDLLAPARRAAADVDRRV
jgi:glycosyltransferase involved in cell wall biosynthesis